MSEFDDAIAAMIRRHGAAWRDYTAEDFRLTEDGGRMTRDDIALLAHLATNPRDDYSIANLKPNNMDLATFVTLINYQASISGFHDELTDGRIGAIMTRAEDRSYENRFTLPQIDRARLPVTIPVPTSITVDRGMEVTATFGRVEGRTLPPDIASEAFWAREMLRNNLAERPAGESDVTIPAEAILLPREVVNGLAGREVLPYNATDEQFRNFVYTPDTNDDAETLNYGNYVDDNFAGMIGFSIGMDPTFAPGFTGAYGVPIDIEWRGTESELLATVRAIYDEQDGPVVDGVRTDRQVPYDQALAAMATIGRRYQENGMRFDYENVIGAGPAPTTRSDVIPPVTEEVRRAA